MARKFVYSRDQKFECKDCPARCCALPWAIQLSPDETARMLDEPWIQERLGDHGLTVLRRQVLPMGEAHKRLRCAFLDDDDFCSMQKEFGHDYLPRSCQVFPFGFVQNEKKETVVQLSRHCPAVRDSYGQPLKSQLPAKIKQQGGAQSLATKMGMLSGTVLSTRQYLQAVSVWQERIAEEESTMTGLADLFDWMDAFEEEIPDERRVDDATVSAALDRAEDCVVEPLEARARTTFHGRVAFAHLLGHLCYPSRIRLGHRLEKTSSLRLVALRAFVNKLAWMLERGTVDMLFVPGPLRLGRVRRVARFLDGDHGRLVRDYLLSTLERRQVLVVPRHLKAVLVDLALAATLISRFARCRAAADGRTDVSADDVREAIGMGDLLVLGRSSVAQQDATLTNLRETLLTGRDAFRRLIAVEA